MSGFKDKWQKLINPPDDEYEDYYEDDDQGDSYSNYDSSPRLSYSRNDPRDNKVVSLNDRRQMQMVVFKPTSFKEDACTIADELLNRNTVVLNLEKADKEVRRRIVDFLSGVAYANNGRLKLIAANIVIITPYNVDLTGDDVLDELESSGIYF